MNIRVVLVAVAILGLSLVIIPPMLHIPEMGNMWRKDGKFIPMLKEISRLIPENESIVSYSFDPAVFYFTGHQIEVPSNISSYDSIRDFMEKENYRYLLTVERQYKIPALDSKFEKSYVTNLIKDFKEIVTYNTEFTRLHLYKRI